jgi:hypothetical protein
MCVCNEKLRVSDISGYVRVLYSYQNTWAARYLIWVENISRSLKYSTSHVYDPAFKVKFLLCMHVYVTF